MDQRALQLLEAQEWDRQRGKKIGGIIALIVIVPIMLVTLLAIISVAGA